MQILTDDGFKDFAGVMRKEAECVMVWHERGRIRGSVDHLVMTVDGWKRLDEVVKGDRLVIVDGQKTVVSRVVNIRAVGPMEVYSPVHVDGGRYVSAGVVCHNCAFGGSTSTLVSEEGLDRIHVCEPIAYRLGYDFMIYEEPVAGGLYVMGVDSAMGVGGDYSVVQVVRVLQKGEYRQVAVYRRNTIRPEDFAGVVHDISAMYNSAMYIIENNDIGRTVADVLYYELQDTGMISTDRRGNLGTRADRATKIDACKTLKRMMETGELTIVDAETAKELSRFEEVSVGVYRASGKNHDDLVSALYWAAYCLSQPEIDLEGVSATPIQPMPENAALPPPMYMSSPDDQMFGACINAESFWAGMN